MTSYSHVLNPLPNIRKWLWNKNKKVIILWFRFAFWEVELVCYRLLKNNYRLFLGWWVDSFCSLILIQDRNADTEMQDFKIFWTWCKIFQLLLDYWISHQYSKHFSQTFWFSWTCRHPDWINDVSKFASLSLWFSKPSPHFLKSIASNHAF